MFRALVLAVLMFGLAACEDDADRAPFAQSRVPPGLAGRFFPPEGWAWGYVQSGAAPPQRYGVSAPRSAPRAQVLIVTGSGETAEAWFETARDLNDAGFTVWVLERAGQAGSGRFASPRDLIHAPSLDPDLNAVRAMVALIIRPAIGQRLTLMAQRDAAVVALAALERRVAVDALILSAPVFGPGGESETSSEAFLRRIGRSDAKASGWRQWSREADASQADDPRRGVQRAWQTANPDLRMSGESVGWRHALRDAGVAAKRGAPSVAVPTSMIMTRAGRDDTRMVCDAMPSCRHVVVQGARTAFHLEPDARRQPWLEEVIAMIGG